MSQNALKVLYRLKDCGYQSYLVGGCVRDLLLGLHPKDFDVATDATPEQIRTVFRNCRLIGRRFRLAHIHFGRDYIEVATFRGTGEDDDQDGREMRGGRLIADNIYGSIEEDAIRRDFTVNAMYYNIEDFSVRDDVGGYDDLRQGVLRMIGDPEERFREDPVRLLRAVRFAAKLDFDVEPATEAPLYQLGDLLNDIPPARLFDEVLKLFLSGQATRSLDRLLHYRLFSALFPDAGRVALASDSNRRMLADAMANTDQRVAEDKPVTPAFLFAVLLWGPMRERAAQLEAEGMVAHEAIVEAGEWITSRQVSHTAIPRRFSIPMREIWQMQPRFEQPVGRKAMRLMEHPRFRAAYDFLLLRAVEDPSLEPLAAEWTKLQAMNPNQLRESLYPDSAPKGRRGRRRRRSRSGKGAANGDGRSEQ